MKSPPDDKLGGLFYDIPFCQHREGSIATMQSVMHSSRIDASLSFSTNENSLINHLSS